MHKQSIKNVICANLWHNKPAHNYYKNKNVDQTSFLYKQIISTIVTAQILLSK